MTHHLRLTLLALSLGAAAMPAVALDTSRAELREFIAALGARHGFEPATLERMFAQVESRKPILEAISRPAEKTMAWHEYRARFLIERRIERGATLWQEQEAALERAAVRGVAPQIILGIVGVETFYGEITGKYRVVDALSTLAFDYPPRSEFFSRELEQYLLMAREESLDPLEPLGSYAGAMGIPQFMPSSFRRYSVDGDGDGRRDLWRNWSDVFASVSNYLAEHGWRAGEPVMVAADVADAKLDGLDFSKLDLNETVAGLRARGVKFETTLPGDAPAVLIDLVGSAGPEYRVGFRNFYAITRYNRSEMYASAVADLAEAIAGRRTAPAESRAEPQPSL